MDVHAQGNLCNEPELKYSKDGTAYCNFRVAITMGKTMDNKDYETRFFDVVCFRTYAENLASSLQKGDRVSVTGQLRMQKWTSKEGKEGESMKIEADEVCPSIQYATVKITRNPKAGEAPLKKQSAPDDVNTDDLPF